MDRHHKNPYEDYRDGDAVSVDENWVRNLIIQYVTPIKNIDLNRSGKDRRGDLYGGNAGIAYMFLKLRQSQFDFRLLDPLLQAQRFINEAKENAMDPMNYTTERDDRCSFLRGNAGIYCVSAKISSISHKYDETWNDFEAYKRGYEVCKPLDFIAGGSDEMLVGRAGYLSGIYWINKQIIPKQFNDQQITELCEIVVESGRNRSGEKGSRFPLLYKYNGTDFLGAQNGLCSVLHMLLESPWFKRVQNPAGNTVYDYSSCPENSFKLIKNAIDRFVEFQDDNGNFPCSADDLGHPEEERTVNWCNGAPGAIYLLIKSYLIFKDKKYLNSCRKVADLVWQYGLLKRGPGLCCGVAGNGYVFLMMYRLTGEPKYLYRATRFAQFLRSYEFIVNAQTNDSFTLFEGVAGTVCFLVDLLEPQKACFPFMDVF